MDPYKILRYPHMTEKSISLVERQNRLVFIVDRKSTKNQIKQAFEEAFNVKVQTINTMITRSGTKKAFIKLKPEYHAADVAVKLGII
ncbi:MAG: 50S ribosomal protein L23 [Candidatus Aenigmarchaeota archaeon CG_4_10_14_0_8_um_filter_37_24]|nr:50S ribosomal protein L23 [Candidatus Aenigmarchaeota archaeon]OIN86562.1 MAG: 50S ribosomal protein L23 [Candidatus Aenigmarchaeota archaeon CG1_02_38_14]PIV69452.1 MAG: 50S ribosomal protein L23 [Candidatus Aenigmarchaeota archaeon CG01_land_8_20_14_3_00_37_9]PIW41698.1 MAG: 50S ribosomal protein L23 [Candidatus Aenigmarchaeota archaeon CG15_BIG_FIL_POST_REV_8_21_14_020_37_27]PIX50556.1 MAG: 50S ribosomal protein L23 [Candidatus Aenigmarchaeota archaeon CG_4_8_14_3_um_filter_37_24]PIY3489